MIKQFTNALFPFIIVPRGDLMQTIKSLFSLHNKKNIALICILGVLVLVVLASAAFLACTLFSDSIYHGIFIGDLNVSGMTAEEAETALSEHYAEALNHSVTLVCEDYEKSYLLSDFAARLDGAQTVALAHQLGRTGSITGRLKEIFSLWSEPVNISPMIACDDALLEATISEFAGMFDQPGQDLTIEVGETELTVTRGITGNCINIPKTMARFKETAFSLKDGIFTMALESVLPAEPTAEGIYAEVCGDPVDASYKIENQQLTIVDEKPGIQFDKAEAQRILDQTPGDVITIPITRTPAAVTREQIKAQLFPDLLGSYSTRYNAGDVSRSHNIALASQKINETVLAPGDVFSYNTTVGPRTVARGFRTANVYVGNRIEPGIGGGICQVSSTLFNAVVLADLEIVYRTNHSLPVSYVPMGRDATVSYGSIDFKFSNNTANPIKIVSRAGGGTNSISIYGVKENPERSIEILTERTATRSAKLVQKEDPSLPAGTVKLEQAGADGSSYNTYKITLDNGSVVKRELLTKSTYVPTDRIELVGIMPTEAPLPEESAPASADASGDTPDEELPQTESTPAPSPTMPPVPIQNPAATQQSAETTPVPSA